MDSVLRDLERERSKIETDVNNLYRHYEKLAAYVRQHLEASTIEWAKLVADHPRALLLAVETTRIVDQAGYSYGGESEPIRLTTRSLANGEMWDQLLRPTHSAQVQGTEYHGLTMADVEDRPTISEAWPTIAEQLEGRHLVIFGADHARAALRTVYQTSLLDGAYCLHNKAKEYYNQFYQLSLEAVLGYQGIEKKREDLKDSRDRLAMLALVVTNLAAGMKKQSQEDETANDDLSDHPF
jgi:DNA polymerase III epsilon subunit-like protein